jgi:riboflavin synthase alpha subunit
VLRRRLDPETLARTTLGAARTASRVHLEGDAIGKWVEHLARPWLRERPLGD